jgi:hypothetical protein
MPEDFLAEKRQEIAGRLSELKPAVEEYRRLSAAQDALAGVLDGSSRTSTRDSRRGPGRPRSSKATSAASPAAKRNSVRPGRRKGTGNRAAEALRHVTEQPGITIPELAAKMGIKQNYLYRVLPGLAKEKKIKKHGRSWHPVQSG